MSRNKRDQGNYRLEFEQLEDRVVPSEFAWTGRGADSFVEVQDSVNSDPVAEDDFAFLPPGETTVDVDALANDFDADGDPLTMSIVTQGQFGTAEVNDNGTPTDRTDDFIRYTRSDTLGGAGNDTIFYEVDDGRGGTDTAAVFIQFGGSSLLAASAPDLVAVDSFFEDFV